MKTNNDGHYRTTLPGTYRLSPHFQLQEMTASRTARSLGIDNTPEQWNVARMKNLCQEVLEPLRREFGPIRINSGYRCQALNEAVHGVGSSQHLLGEAADIYVPDLDTGRRYYAWLVAHTNFDQLLFEYSNKGQTRWLHVSCKWDKALNRHQCFPNYKA